MHLEIKGQNEPFHQKQEQKAVIFPHMKSMHKVPTYYRLLWIIPTDSIEKISDNYFYVMFNP